MFVGRGHRIGCRFDSLCQIRSRVDVRLPVERSADHVTLFWGLGIGVAVHQDTGCVDVGMLFAVVLERFGLHDLPVAVDEWIERAVARFRYAVYAEVFDEPLRARISLSSV